MGKRQKSAEIESLIAAMSSEDSQNQGFLKFSEEEAAHGRQVARGIKSRKGLKSGEPFSDEKHINLEA